MITVMLLSFWSMPTFGWCGRYCCNDSVLVLCPVCRHS